MPKWNPLAPTTDLCDKLKLTAEELEATRNEIKIDEPMTYDPNFRLNSTTNGWRIFAEDDSMHEIPAQRQLRLEPAPDQITAFIHIKVLRAGQYDPQIMARFKIVSDVINEDATVNLTFDDPSIKTNFRSGILGATLTVLQKIPYNTPLLLCSSSDFLLKTLIKKRTKSENDMLDPSFQLFKAVFAALNERVATTRFMQTTITFPVPADIYSHPPLEVDTQIDLMFSCPGILISQGSQRLFTKIIKGRRS